MKRVYKIVLILILHFVIILIGSLWFYRSQLKKLPSPTSFPQSHEATEISLSGVIEYSLKMHIIRNWKAFSNYKGTNYKGEDKVQNSPRAVTEKYLPIWKTLFTKRNNIPEDYFNEHVEVVDTGITVDRDWWKFAMNKDVLERGREYFTILYKIEIDWIRVFSIDRFAIKEANSEEYLELPKIEENLNIVKSSSQGYPEVITKFIPIQNSIFSSSVEAFQALKQVDVPRSSRYLEPNLFRLDEGEVILWGYGTIDYEKINVLGEFLI